MKGSKNCSFKIRINRSKKTLLRDQKGIIY
jgi:hypothetical protein